MLKKTIFLCSISGYINVTLWSAQCHTKGGQLSNLIDLGTTPFLAIKKGCVNGCDVYLSIYFFILKKANSLHLERLGA